MERNLIQERLAKVVEGRFETFPLRRDYWHDVMGLALDGRDGSSYARWGRAWYSIRTKAGFVHLTVLYVDLSLPVQS